MKRVALLAAACAAVGAVACRDTTTMPAAKNPGATSKSVGLDPDSLLFRYLCGNEFRVRASNDSALTLQWKVSGTSDSGTVTLPPRLPNWNYSDTTFTTDTIGPTGLFLNGQLVQIAQNQNTICRP